MDTSLATGASWNNLESQNSGFCGDAAPEWWLVGVDEPWSSRSSESALRRCRRSSESYSVLEGDEKPLSSLIWMSLPGNGACVHNHKEEQASAHFGVGVVRIQVWGVADEERVAEERGDHHDRVHSQRWQEPLRVNVAQNKHNWVHQDESSVDEAEMDIQLRLVGGLHGEVRRGIVGLPEQPLCWSELCLEDRHTVHVMNLVSDRHHGAEVKGGRKRGGCVAVSFHVHGPDAVTGRDGHKQFNPKGVHGKSGVERKNRKTRALNCMGTYIPKSAHHLVVARSPSKKSDLKNAVRNVAE
ncbi:hypothetical protein KL907_003671 [Ogataea polymorpha]|nr:hypothetical protein KL907_003671 [Ogataea polymorpha]